MILTFFVGVVDGGVNESMNKQPYFYLVTLFFRKQLTAIMRMMITAIDHELDDVFGIDKFTFD